MGIQNKLPSDQNYFLLHVIYHLITIYLYLYLCISFTINMDIVMHVLVFFFPPFLLQSMEGLENFQKYHSHPATQG